MAVWGKSTPAKGIKKAIEYYSEALNMVKYENRKKRISSVLDNLKK
jgi:hypothetical protein